MNEIITPETARAILAAGGFADDPALVRETARKLDDVARAFLGNHYLDRWQDKRKKRLRVRPDPRLRRAFIGGVEGVWLALPHKGKPHEHLPSVIYSPTRKRYEGPYTRFFQAFAGAIAAHLTENQSTQDKFWSDFVKMFRRLERNGADDLSKTSARVKAYARLLGRVEDGLRDLSEARGLGRWASAMKPTAPIDDLVLDLLKLNGPANAEEISKEIRVTIPEVERALRRLVSKGLAEVPPEVE